MEHQVGFFDQGSNNSSSIPDEIDGDDRLGVSQRTGKVSKFAPVKEEVVSDVEDADEHEHGQMDESMYIDGVETEVNENSFVDDASYV